MEGETNIKERDALELFKIYKYAEVTEPRTDVYYKKHQKDSRHPVPWEVEHF